MNRSCFLNTFGVAVVIFCMASWTCSKQSPEQAEKIRVGYLPIIAHLPALVAQEQGYLNNVPVDFQVYATSNDLLSALQRGDIDATTAIAIAPVSQVAQKTVAEGKIPTFTFFSFSRTGKSEPFDGLFVKKNSRITKLSDLSGKTIGVFPGTTARNILKYFLENIQNVRTKTIKWSNLPPNVQIDALRSGDIDALYTYEPTCTIARLNGMVELYGSAIGAVQEGAPYGGSVISKSFETLNPKLSEAFIEAIDKGVLFTRENPRVCRQILVSKLGISKEVAESCNLEFRYTSTEIRDSSRIADFQQFVDKLVAMKEISASFDVAVLIRH